MPHAVTSTTNSCKFRHALLRGLRPIGQSQKIQCGVCPTRCIYCDIWMLATLIYSHGPASPKHKSHSRTSSSSSATTQCLSRSSSSSSNSSSSSHNEYEMSAKTIDASFQTQRARLASILSICTVDGAEESEGLRIAHDRCLSSVTDLMKQKSTLQERAAAAAREEYAASVRISEMQQQYQQEESVKVSRRISRHCGSGNIRERYLSESREGSYLSMAR